MIRKKIAIESIGKKIADTYKVINQNKTLYALPLLTVLGMLPSEVEAGGLSSLLCCCGSVDDVAISSESRPIFSVSPAPSSLASRVTPLINADELEAQIKEQTPRGKLVKFGAHLAGFAKKARTLREKEEKEDKEAQQALKVTKIIAKNAMPKKAQPAVDIAFDYFILPEQ